MCPLSRRAFWYRRLLREATALQSLEKATKGEGGADNFQKLNSLLMQLRKCCNHPFLFSGTDVPEEGVQSKSSSTLPVSSRCSIACCKS